MGLLNMVLSLILATTLVAQEPALDRARLASQAQSLAEQLPNLISTEVLKQKSISYSTRMRIRLGEGALRPIAPKIREREIVSDQLVACALQVFAEGIPGLVGAALDLSGRPLRRLARHFR